VTGQAAILMLKGSLQPFVRRAGEKGNLAADEC
jgi:hypothetical protein